MSIEFYTLCYKGYYEAVSLNIKGQSLTVLNLGICGACRKGHCDIVELLINSGANDYDVPYNISYQEKNYDIAKLLIKKGCIPSCYKYPENREEIIFLLELGLELTKLKKMEGYKLLKSVYDFHNSYIYDILDRYIIPDLNKIVSGFCLF